MRHLDLTLEPATDLLDLPLSTRLRHAHDVADELVRRGYPESQATTEACAARNLPGWEQLSGN